MTDRGGGGKDRLIVALDVPTGDEALDLVRRLPNVSFFKVGYQLFMSGDLPTVLRELDKKNLFVDLKVPGDITNTIQSIIRLCLNFRVKFLTLSANVPTSAVKAAVLERGDNDHPKLLSVPYLSSLDASDLVQIDPEFAKHADLDEYIKARAKVAIEAGCDGLIASGDAIRLLGKAYPEALLVSPGIRPAGHSADDHKRLTTPAEAIRLGADYLVVGRPIRQATNPQEAAQRIIDEIDRALGSKE